MTSLFIRKRGLGLESLRSVIQVMEENINIRNNISARRIVGNGGYAFLWGYVDDVPRNFVPVNTSGAVGLTSNKGKFRMMCYNEGLSMYTTTNRGEALDFMSTGQKLIVRPRNHMGGSNLYLVSNEQEFNNATRHCGAGWYASEYIPKVAEYRVFIAQDRVVWVANKEVEDTNSIAWNHHEGSVFNNIRFGSWPIKVVKQAILAHKLSGLNFSAVDIIVDEYDNSYVLELNTAPQISSEYRIEKTAKTFDYMIRNGIDDIYVNLDKTSWRDFIHPACSDEAITAEQFEPRYITEFNQNNSIKVSYQTSLQESTEVLTYYPSRDAIKTTRIISLTQFNECLELAKSKAIEEGLI